MNVKSRLSPFVLLAFVGGLFIMGVTLFLIACLHLVKLFFKMFIQRERIFNKTKETQGFQFSKEDTKLKPDLKRNNMKTILTEPISVESEIVEPKEA